jgi:predicted MFS family arabinose efflux permease
MSLSESSSPLERKIIAIVACVQFVHIVDFMMVMPLGPDFAKELGIRVSHLGVVAGAYTLAAAISGVICSFFIDRLDRKIALILSVVGLGIGTASGAWAQDFHSLLFARVLAGVFGGPAASTSLALISDVVPHLRRGKALGTAMMSFSLASVFGVPMGLELARMGGWQMPFIVIGSLALVVALFVLFALPSMTGHRSQALQHSIWEGHLALLKQPSVWHSYSLTFCLMMSGFLVFPNIASYVQLNLGFPRDDMGKLYLAGGIVSFAVMRFVGILVDRYGSALWFLVGSIGFFFGLIGGFFGNPPLMGPYGIFLVFMSFGTVRNIAANTLTSKVPKPSERAGFMSLQSSVQHTATAFGGIASSRLLTTDESGKLAGFSALILGSGLLIVIAILQSYRVQRLIKSHEH